MMSNLSCSQASQRALDSHTEAASSVSLPTSPPDGGQRGNKVRPVRGQHHVSR